MILLLSFSISAQLQINRYAINKSGMLVVETNYFLETYEGDQRPLVEIEGKKYFWHKSDNCILNLKDKWQLIDELKPMSYSESTGKSKSADDVEVQLQSFKSEAVKSMYREKLLNDIVYNKKLSEKVMINPFDKSLVSKEYTVITIEQYNAALKLMDEAKYKTERGVEPEVAYKEYIKSINSILNI